MAPRKKPSTTFPSVTVANVRGGLEGRDESALETAQRQVLPLFKERMKENQPFCREQWDLWEENQKFTGGGKAQWDKKSYERREKSGRPTFTFNDCGLAARAVSGWEITARFEPSFESRDRSDGPWTEALRDVVRFIRQNALAGTVESDAFRDLAIGNYSVLEWTRRFDGEEPRGRTCVETNPLWEYLWDARAREMCLKDRAWDARGYFVDVDEFVMSFPLHSDKIQGLIARENKAWWTKEAETKYRHPWSGMAMEGRFIQPNKKLIFLVDYEWREVEPAWTATVPPGVDPHPVGPDAWRQAAEALGFDPVQMSMQLVGEGGEQMGQQVQMALRQAAAQGLVPPGLAELAAPRLIKMDKDAWETYAEKAATVMGAPPDAFGPEDGNRRWVRKSAAIAGDDILRVKKLPFRHFPRIFLTGAPIKLMDGTRMQSVVEGMKDPQKFKNFVTTIMASILQRSGKQGAIYAPNTFEDEGDMESRLAEPGYLLRTRPGVDPAAALHWDEGPGFPSGTEKYLELADSAAWRGTGLNPNLLGNLQDPRRVSGVVWNQQVEAVTKVLAWEFDSLRTSRMIEGELILDHVAEYMEPEDVRDILGPDRAHLVPPKSEWKHRLKYDAVVAEVPVSKSEQEASWEYWSRQGTLEKWVQQGIVPPWFALEMVPDTWVSKEIKKKIFDWQDARGMGPNSAPPPPAGAEGGGEEQPPEGQ